MTVHYLNIHIAEDEWLRVYAGRATHVHCKSTAGIRISIAAKHFRRFTTHDGVRGLFKLTLKGNLFLSLERIR